VSGAGSGEHALSEDDALVELTARQYSLLQRAELWRLVDLHGSILRAAAREPEYAADLGQLNAAMVSLLRVVPATPAYEARVRGALREVLRERRRREAATPRS
jgi:hypothetical protein